MSNFLSIVCSLVFSYGLFAQPPSYTLQEAIDYAVEKNDQIKLKQLEIQDADAQILEYWATGIPTLDGSVNYQHFINIPVSLIPAEFFGGPPGTFQEIQFGTKNNLQGSLELNALIFDGSFFVGLKAQQLYKDLRQKELKQTSTEVEYNVTKAFMNVLVANKNLEILENNIENLQENLNEVRASYQEGFVEKLDVDRLELSLQQLKTQLQSVEGNAWVAKNLLKFQMGFPINDSMQLEGDLETAFQADLIKKVNTDAKINVEKRPEHDVALQGLELNNVNIRRQKATYLPTVRGFASHSESLQRNDLFNENEAGWLPSTIVGATLSLRLFDGFNRKAKIQRAKISREKTLQQINQLEESIRMEVMNARIQYNNAQRQLNDAKRNLDLSEEIYETTQTKFDEGVGSSIEVKQAEADFYSAQSTYINALYDLLNAYTELQKANGTL
jgi:outer membrane protein TolC